MPVATNASGYQQMQDFSRQAERSSPRSQPLLTIVLKAACLRRDTTTMAGAFAQAKRWLQGSKFMLIASSFLQVAAGGHWGFTSSLGAGSIQACRNSHGVGWLIAEVVELILPGRKMLTIAAALPSVNCKGDRWILTGKPLPKNFGANVIHCSREAAFQPPGDGAVRSGIQRCGNSQQLKPCTGSIRAWSALSLP